ncbi:hypothetical protein AALB39_04240 [Lachnospiraceae bacterium 54-53]
MKKYKGNRKYDDICRLMKEQGMEVDTKDFDNGGDFMNFKGSWHNLPLTIVSNTFNGQFFVYNGFTGNQMATYLSEELDGEPWYNDLLNLLYEPLEAE